jgi:hypothetical protein
MQTVRIGDAVSGEFEHHDVNDYQYSLLHWRANRDSSVGEPKP